MIRGQIYRNSKNKYLLESFIRWLSFKLFLRKMKYNVAWKLLMLTLVQTGSNEYRMIQTELYVQGVSNKAL